MASRELLLSVGQAVASKVGHASVDQLSSLKPEGWEYVGYVGVLVSISQLVYILKSRARQYEEKQSTQDKAEQPIDIQPQRELRQAGNPARIKPSGNFG